MAAFVTGIVAISTLVGFAAAANDPSPGAPSGEPNPVEMNTDNVDVLFTTYAKEFPIPAGTSLERVKGYALKSGAAQSADTFRFVLGFNAICLWSDQYLNDGKLSREDSASFETLINMPVMRVNADDSLGKVYDSLSTAMREGDRERVASWDSTNCPS